MPTSPRISPFLWFDHQAEEAASFYVDIFPDSRITRVARYPEAGQEIHRGTPGSVMTVEFELDGQRFVALNGGPVFTFNESISFEVECETQEEIDRLWSRLGEGGDPRAQQCGWLKDRFGLSWQITPRQLADMMSDPDAERAGRVMEAMLKMKKIDLAELERAYQGEAAAAGA
jgi:predicted 3-demethylubiquinone-9 3-methyltransferase (glyoxalase superfamily)